MYNFGILFKFIVQHLIVTIKGFNLFIFNRNYMPFCLTFNFTIHSRFFKRFLFLNFEFQRFYYSYVGDSNEIAHLLDSRIATNTLPSIKKKFCPRKTNFHSFLYRYISLLLVYYARNQSYSLVPDIKC